MDKLINKLLIIGNGFDLQCELASSFSDYIKDFKEQNPFLTKGRDIILNEWTPKTLVDSPHLSLWEMLLFIREEKYKDWSDIERMLYTHLIKKHDSNGRKISNIEQVILNGFKIDNEKENNELDEEDIEYLKIFCVPYLLSGNSLYENIETFLYEETRKFERNFTNYLKIEINNSSYYFKSSNLAHQLISQEQDKNNDSRYLLINFNYTDPRMPNFVKQQVNVHGTLNNNDIIIGIDFKDFDFDDVGFSLTKTYRRMPQNTNRSTNVIFNKNINEIIVYGHSLNEQDYSYFYSIFDYLDLYNNPVSLKFLFSSNYFKNEPKHEQASVLITKRVSKLIIDYGRTMDNKDHGKNLLHKLLLEGRLSFKNIDR